MRSILVCEQDHNKAVLQGQSWEAQVGLVLCLLGKQHDTFLVCPEDYVNAAVQAKET